MSNYKLLQTAIHNTPLDLLLANLATAWSSSDIIEI